ncbi:MAG: tetratricopeptide repeat protein [Candidatus Omnitrophica bacterium]|nr:tetratricopeptide repeat protein [Candidatus Omnitrophota bacterium]
MNKAKNFNLPIFCVILLFGFALYFYPLRSTTFSFDDHFSIETNEVVKNIDVPKIFKAFNTRFLVGLSFALNYKCCGLHPEGFRLINLLLHCLNAFLVYLLVQSTLSLYAKSKEIFHGRLEWPSFFASMLFLCHPIQTEPVNFITQRFVLMGTFFYLLSLIFYVKSKRHCEERSDEAISLKKDFPNVKNTARKDTIKFYYLCSLISAIAAMFCKEFVVTLPLMLVLWDFYFLEALAEPRWKRCRRILPFFFIALIVPLLLLKTPKEAIGVANIAQSKHMDITRAHTDIGRKQYFLTELNVVCTYIRLLFLPINQNLDYDYPLSHALDPKTALCGAFLLCLLGLAAVTYKTCRIISFSILWFFIALSVESSFIPIGHVIAEYRLYLASVGFVFLITTLIYMGQGSQRRINWVTAFILIGFSILTYQRNKVWMSDFVLWDDTARKSPHKARPYNNRGNAYEKQGNLTQAMLDYNKAIEINPKYAEAYYNRGKIYNQQGKVIQALSDYSKAIEQNPDYAEAYDNRGTIYGRHGDVYRAIADFTKAIEINPRDAQAYFNRGLVFYYQKIFHQSILDYTKAIELDPENAQAYSNRGNVYDDEGNLSQGITDYTKAIAVNPHYSEAYDNRGIDYCKQGNFVQAISDFTKAIEIDPKFSEGYNNRGFAYFKVKKYDKAWADVNKAKALGYAIDQGFIKLLGQESGRQE